MKKLLKLILLAAALISILSLSACGKKNDGNDSSKPMIAVSIVPQETFVKAVCGNLVNTITMVPPGFSPENYEPTPEIMEKFGKASVYFTVGVQTEANILPSASKDVQIVHLEDEVASTYEDVKMGEGRDPHIWLSPKRVIVMVNAIAEKMSEIDPQNANEYRKNADEYIAELNGVDTEIKNALEGVATRKFIVFHPAFGYLAADYDLTMYSLEEEGKEATASHLQQMIDLAKKENIKVIFYQEEIDSTQSKAFAEEIGGKTIMLSPLSPDYIENMKLMAKTMAEAMQ